MSVRGVRWNSSGWQQVFKESSEIHDALEAAATAAAARCNAEGKAAGHGPFAGDLYYPHVGVGRNTQLGSVRCTCEAADKIARKHGCLHW